MSAVLDQAAQIIAQFPAGGELIELLLELQAAVGFVPPQAVALIAEKIGCERPAVYKAVELAPSLTITPPGKHLLYVCQADTCCAQGGHELAETAKQLLGADFNHCDAQQKVRLEAFHCLGNCFNGPNIAVDRIVQGDMTPEKLTEVIEGLLAAD